MPGVPFDRSAIGRYASREDWARTAPSIVAERLEAWKLARGEAFTAGVAGMVFEAETSSGMPAVLKIGFPHDEATWEPVALAAFGEDLAPRIIEQDSVSWSLLMERVRPGGPLSTAPMPPATALRIGGALHAELARRDIPAGLPTLASLVGEYTRSARNSLGQLDGQLRDLGIAKLVAKAVDLLERLAADDVAPALVHGDYNPGNILDSGGGRWRAIDPKPVAGDPSFDLWPLVSQLGATDDSRVPAAQLERQLEVAAESAAIDSERAALWAFARAGVSLTWRLAESDQGERDRFETLREARLLSAWAEVARQ